MKISVLINKMVWSIILRARKNRRMLERFSRQDFISDAFKMLDFNKISGDYAEFGCHGGNTFFMAWLENKRYSGSRHMWAFDSFNGLPYSENPIDNHPKWIPGKMNTSLDDFIALNKYRGLNKDKDYTAVPGFFERSLVEFDQKLDKIAFAYIDCDLFTSTNMVLEFIAPRLQHGGILAFDDWWCWSSTLKSGEMLAMAKFHAEEYDFRLHDYGRYGWHGQAFVVEKIIKKQW